MRTYELMVIHRPELPEDQVRDRVTEIHTVLQDQGAVVGETDFWGKRRFAYEIDHMNEGYYSVVTFQADGDAVNTLDRVLSLADIVVRHKIIRPDAE